MSFTEKIDVLELLISLLQEHEQKLDSLVEKLEIVDQTIKQSPLKRKSSIYEGTIVEDSNYNEILIVDDDENLVNTFKLILEDAGFGVDTALTGLAALRMLKNKIYDLVILDINLPDMLGYQIQEEMETNGTVTEFIYITGYSALKDTYNSVNKKAEILLKPVNPEKLLETTTKYVTGVSINNNQSTR